MTVKSRRLTHLTVWLGIAVLVIAALVAKDALVESYWLSKLDSEVQEDREVAAQTLGEMKSIRAIPRLVRLMIENAERHFPQMKDMAVHETLAETLWGFNGNRVTARDALHTYSVVTGLNLVTTRQFPEQDEVRFPGKGERYTVAEILEHLLEQTELEWRALVRQKHELHPSSSRRRWIRGFEGASNSIRAFRGPIVRCPKSRVLASPSTLERRRQGSPSRCPAAP